MWWVPSDGEERGERYDKETDISRPCGYDSVPDGMEEYAALSFFCGDAEWKLEFLAQEDMVESGELMLDDRCHFVIRAVSGEQNFVLFDETVQLGNPQGDVFTDVENQLHIVIQDARTAQYRIIDYRYDEGENVFFGEVLAD